MATNIESTVHTSSTIDDLDFMVAFNEAIQAPDLREQIIYVLESAGLLPVSVRLPA